jgi:hypothetical protein
MATNRITYRLVVKESPLRERYDALLATLQDLHFEIGPKGRDLYLTPSPEGLQPLIERRAEFEAALAAYDDIIMEYPHIQTVVVPPEEEDAV